MGHIENTIYGKGAKSKKNPIYGKGDKDMWKDRNRKIQYTERTKSKITIYGKDEIENTRYGMVNSKNTIYEIWQNRKL